MLCSLNSSILTEANQQIVAMLSLIWVFCLTHISAHVSVPSPAPPSSASFPGANGKGLLSRISPMEMVGTAYCAVKSKLSAFSVTKHGAERFTRDLSEDGK